MGAESGMNSSVRDDRVALSDGAKALWGKTNRIDDSEWLPLYVHMVDSAAMASKIWDTWVPQGTKAVIVGDLGNDEVLARKLMIFMAGIHDIGKATPVFQAKSITFGPEAGSFAWKAERAGLPMIAGLRGTNHPTHPIAGEIILEGYLLRVRGWERKAARQYACVVGGHHGTPPDKSKIDEEKNRKTNVGLDSEAWVSTQDELIDFVANIAGIEEKEWEDLSERRFSVQSAVLMTGLVIMADWIASNSDEDMFPLVRTEPWADEDEDFFFSESGEEDDIQSWSGLRIRADRAWSCVQLPHAWVPEGIPSSCQDLFATRFTLPEGAKVRPVQEEAVRIARDTRQPGLMVIEAPMGEGKTEAALAAAEILAQRTGRGGVCVALPTMATTDAMFTRVRRWLEALPSCDFDNEKTVWLAHGKAQLNNDFRGIIAASHRRFSSVDQDDVKQESSQNRKKKQIDVPPETVVSDWLWGRKKGALANFLVCTVDQVLDQAIHTPKWPLFLGRRSCPPDYPLSLGIHDEYADVRQALDSEPWHAAKWYRRRYRQPDLEIVCDAMEGEDTSVQSDLPLSFSSTGRKYADRVVYRYRIPNPDASENVGDNTEKPPSFDSTGEADPMSFI